MVKKIRVVDEVASDDSVEESIDVTSNQVTGSGTSQITISPTNDLQSSTEFYIKIDATAFDDLNSNSYEGIADKTTLSFTSADIVAPTIASVSSTTKSDYL